MRLKKRRVAAHPFPCNPGYAEPMPPATFRCVSPFTGQPIAREHRIAPPDEVDSVCLAAAEAFEWLWAQPRGRRVALLRGIADSIAALGESLLTIASEETGLSVPRLAGERDRTIFTLRMFADAVADGSCFRPAFDAANPGRAALPKPDLRRVLVPLGPVAVFGASNFPLAYSTAGGDTASALAAGCPVVVKGHPLHPGTGEMVAAAVGEAVRSAGCHHGVFAYLPCGGGGERELAIGQELVTHPAIAAVGFTGSFKGGMALHKLAGARASPIPVFAEMGSINPVFILPDALAREGAAIAQKLFGSFTNSNGQMCTKPGLVIVQGGPGAEAFAEVLAALVNSAPAQTMLSDRIRSSFLSRLHDVGEVPGVDAVARSRPSPDSGIYQPAILLRTAAATLSRFPTLHDECFGPAMILVVCRDAEEMQRAAANMPGALAAAIFAAESDHAVAQPLTAALVRRVGRLVFNGLTTGVEVSPAMVHGGPYPATNQPHTTAVGIMALERWCRPVCYQNAPEGLLAGELR